SPFVRWTCSSPIIFPLCSSCGRAWSRVQAHALQPRRVAWSCASVAVPRPRSHLAIRYATGIQAYLCSDQAAIGTGALAASPAEEPRQGGGQTDCRCYGSAPPAPRGGDDRPTVLRVL